MKDFIKFWKQKTRVSQILLILSIMYCVSSIIVLLITLGVVRLVPAAYLNPLILIWFSMISFAVASLLSIYHFITFVVRRKRKSDQRGMFQSEEMDRSA